MTDLFLTLNRFLQHCAVVCLAGNEVGALRGGEVDALYGVLRDENDTLHLELYQIKRKSINHTNTAKQSSLKYSYLSL
jgi:hypothetical protein